MDNLTRDILTQIQSGTQDLWQRRLNCASAAIMNSSPGYGQDSIRYDDSYSSCHENRLMPTRFGLSWTPVSPRARNCRSTPAR
jgi:hypothetical protein